MAYVCAELEKVKNIYGGYDCKTWAVQQSTLTDLAITGEQALGLTSMAVTLFMLVFSYKIVKKILFSI